MKRAYRRSSHQVEDCSVWGQSGSENSFGLFVASVIERSGTADAESIPLALAVEL